MCVCISSVDLCMCSANVYESIQLMHANYFSCVRATV